MNEIDRISVIITTYNYGRYIGEAIESVLNQTYPNIEIIIIDDGSVDDTKSVVNNYGNKVIYYYQENRGQCAALNEGLRIASGQYISFLDADDRWEKNKLQIQYDYLIQNRDVEIVFGCITHFYSPELTTQEMAKYHLPLGSEPAQLKSTMLSAYSVFEKVGNFNMNNNFSDFLEWFSRVKEAGINFAMLSTLSTKRRIHGSNMTTAYKVVYQDELLSFLRSRIKNS